MHFFHAFCNRLQYLTLCFFLFFTAGCISTSTNFSKREVLLWQDIVNQQLFESLSTPGVYESQALSDQLFYQFLISPVNSVENSALGVTVTIKKNDSKVESPALFGPGGAVFTQKILTHDKKYYIEAAFIQTGIENKESSTFDSDSLFSITNVIYARYKTTIQ